MSYFTLKASKIVSFWGLHPQTLGSGGWGRTPAKIFGSSPDKPKVWQFDTQV